MIVCYTAAARSTCRARIRDHSRHRIGGGRNRQIRSRRKYGAVQVGQSRAVAGETGTPVTILTAEAAHEMTMADIAARIRAVVGARPTYLSVDIDVLDPAFAPGTGTPEPGGLATAQLFGLLEELALRPCVGMDCVEVAPAYDLHEMTASTAAHIVWTYLSGRARARGGA